MFGSHNSPLSTILRGAFSVTLFLGLLTTLSISRAQADSFPHSSSRNFACVVQDGADRFGVIEFMPPAAAVVESPIGGTFTFSLSLPGAELFEANISADPIIINTQSTGNIGLVLNLDQPSNGTIDPYGNVIIPFSFRLSFFGGPEGLRSSPFIIPASLKGLLHGDSIEASIAGVLPDDVPILGSSSYNIRLSCAAGAQSRFRARFSLDGAPHPVSLTISNGAFVKSLENVVEVDELVPSRATYSIRWAVGSESETAVKDVMDLLIGPTETLELNFYLFRPADVGAISPVLVAEEAGADANVTNVVKRDRKQGTTRLSTVVQGAPGKLIILDTVLSVKADPTTGVPDRAFAFASGGLALARSCAHTDQGGTFPPIQYPRPVPRPSPEPPRPCSSTSSQSCNVNSCGLLPSAGNLNLSSIFRELLDSQIVLATSLRNSASILERSVAVTDVLSNKTIASSELNSAFDVPAGSYVFSFAVPKGVNPRDTYRLAFPIEAIAHQIHQITSFPPAVEDFQDFTPVVVGDSQLGLGTTIIQTSICSTRCEHRLAA